MKSDDSKQSVKDLQSFARKLHQVGGKPHLSRRQKRHMLREILPQKPLFLRLAPAFTAAFFTGVLMVSSFSFASQPGDLLYGVKRDIEDIRSTVQPSYDEQLLKRRDEEIKNLTQSGNNEAKINIVNKEKQVIENRLREHEGTSTSSNKTPSVTTDSSTSIKTESDDSALHNESGGGSTGTVSARDQCRAALDTLKKAGENITSDLYKKCDSL